MERQWQGEHARESKEGGVSTTTRVGTGEDHEGPPAPAQKESTPCATRQNEEQTLGEEHTSSKKTPSVCDITADMEANIPPNRVMREVIVARDSNAARFARTLNTQMGEDQPRNKVLLNRGQQQRATTEVILDLICMYIFQAHRVPRLFILHVGVNDILQDRDPDAFAHMLWERWKECEDSLAICSISQM